MPLAFLAGTHGFAMFAPYAAVVMGALHLRTRHRTRSRARRDAGAIADAPPVAPLPDLEALPLPA